MSELKFSRENNEKYNTVSINIENAVIEINEDEHYVFNDENSKFGYRKAD